jgi:hypothetical protein
MLLTYYIDLAAARARLRRPAGLVVAAVNAVAERIDASSARLREPGPGSIHANYHVTAEVPS